jgi:primary-amine oxidase
MEVEMSLETKATTRVVLHPLDPLTGAEMKQAVSMVRDSGKFGPKMRFVSVSLHEPAKNLVLNYKNGQPIEREAFIIILDNDEGATYEVVASISKGLVTQFKHIPGVQPSIIPAEFFECENTYLLNKSG